MRGYAGAAVRQISACTTSRASPQSNSTVRTTLPAATWRTEFLWGVLCLLLKKALQSPPAHHTRARAPPPCIHTSPCHPSPPSLMRINGVESAALEP